VVLLDHQVSCVIYWLVVPLMWRIELLELGTPVLSRPSCNPFGVRFLYGSSLSGYSETPS